MARKHKHEEHENHERWLVSYADFITLLFAFFVVLYASSRVDTNKLVQMKESVRWAMNFKGNGGVSKLSIFKGPPTEGGCAANVGTSPPAQMMNRQLFETMRKRMERALKTFLLKQKQDKEASITLEVENARLRIRLAASKFFDPASAALRPEALAVLDAIAEEIASTPYSIRVEGHTDDSQIESNRFRNNWDLSAFRAATVVTYLEQAHHIDPARLAASGLASTRPMVPNDTAEHREANRRIEINLELPLSDPLNAAAKMPSP